MTRGQPRGVGAGADGNPAAAIRNAPAVGPEVAPEILDRVVHRIHRVGLALQAASNGTRAAGEGIEQALDELDCALRDIGAVAFVASAPPDDRTSGDGRQPGSAVR